MADPLTTALQGYNDIATSRREIKSATTTFRDLRPFREAYVYQNGARVEMCVLKGTIPVTYQGARYNIPVSIWIPPDFPNRPPIPHVAPTPTMEIKVGKFVDRSGLVTLPYLVNWRHGTHNLYELISVLALQFGEEPPVFARAAPRPPPTRPEWSAGSGYMNQPYQPPPYPGPTSGSNTTTSYPPTLPSQQPYPMYPAQNQAAYPAYPPPVSSTSGGGSYPPPTTSAGAAGGNYPPYPSQNAQYQYPAVSAAEQPKPPGRQNSVAEDTLKVSIISAVEEKIRRQVSEISSQSDTVLEVARKTRDDIVMNASKMDSLQKELQREQAEVRENVALVESKIVALKEALSKADEAQDNVDLDSLVVVSPPLYRQLFQAWCKEQALEDLLYCLSEALRKKALDIDVYLKHVRDVSRKQFMEKALVLRCRRKAGLPDL